MNKLNFWERNEGELIGSLGGLLIAILAAYLTYFFSEQHALKKEKDAYQGLLYTLHLELYWQKNHFVLLRKTLDKLKTASIEKQSFVLESSPMQFNVSIIETVLLKVIDYKYYDYKIVALLTSYLNQIRSINYFLDFKNAKELMHNLNNKQEIEQRIVDYFNVLNNDYIDKTQSVIPDIRKLIEIELKDYPKENMVCAESGKTMINKKIIDKVNL